MGPVSFPGIGHNGGPPLDRGARWRHYCWKQAHTRAWRTPPREIALARLARAEALGITYREYTAVVLDRGTHLQPPLRTASPAPAAETGGDAAGVGCDRR